ncbi:TetM/TetW/TetO/TetS family tetracycline resistance ribosomal protection protein [soil metagenome]
MPTLNLGIVAHVDAGKTTLTERLIFETGVTTHPGRVDHGDTTTDADDLERRRGITIRSAVVTFTVPGVDRADTKINLIDTPGHSDFVAEVERALAVLDGAVLVVSAVEGVQAQTRVLIRILERLGIPFLIFANKIDRAGAAYDSTMAALRDALLGDAVAITEPIGFGSRAAEVATRSGPGFVEELVERLSEYDDRLLRRYVDGVRPPSEEEALASLAEQTRSGRVHPVLFGSALGGVGVADVMHALTAYLPAIDGDAGKALHASVFKIERGSAGHKIAYVRLHDGTLASRDHVVVHRRGSTGTIGTHEARAINVSTFDHGAGTTDAAARVGDIAKVRGVTDLAIGDQLGRWDPARSGRLFPPPGLESVVQARDPAERIMLFQALQQLSEQDPLIDVRLDGVDQEVTVSVYGEVQKEVIAARLEAEYGVVADFLPTRTVHIERVAATGQCFEQTATGNASVALRVEPAAVGSGVEYVLGVERGYLLPSFHVAIEETLARVVGEGVFGWRVTDCLVTLIHGRYHAPTPSAWEYRRLIALAFGQALRQAGTTVCAPVSRFELELPAEALTSVLGMLVAAGATPALDEVGSTRCRVTGTMPTWQVDEFEQRFPGMSSGQGVFFSEPAGYEPVQGSPPTRTARGGREARRHPT